MTVETVFANSISGQTSGAATDIDEGVSAADGNSCDTSSDGEGEVFTVGFADVVGIVDGDTVNSITVRIRVERQDATGEYSIDFRIGGVIQGSQQSTSGLGTSFANFELTDVGWDSDWTQAQLNGMDILMTPTQAGMPTPTTWRLDAAEIDIDFTQVSADLNISATLATLSIAAQNATVNLTREIAAVLATLDIAPQPGTVNLTREIVATLAVLDIASQAADVNLTREITAMLVALNIAAQNATVVKGINLTPTTIALDIAAQNANVNASREIAATLKTLNIASQNATVERVRNIQAALVTLNIQGFNASVDLGGAVAAIVRRVRLTMKGLGFGV